MADSSFFEESTEQSRIKAEIVEKYFWAWAKVILPQVKKRDISIGYIDLFCGPGRYKDGSKSTPLRVLERAIDDPDLRERLLTLFNDADSDNTNSLQQSIFDIPNIQRLQHQPKIFNTEVGEELVQVLETVPFIPTLFFVDPWGYKGLSLNLIGTLIKNWGCDCIFFFNYNRINMGINNQAVAEHMNSLFGEETADSLRDILQERSSRDREIVIVETISQALKRIGGEYVLPFRFKNEKGTRTSHHLIFVSKNVRGYSIMKDIMAKYSSSTEQGVPSFEYNQATQQQPLLFELTRPLDELGDMLLDEFAGRTMTMIEIFDRHHVGKSYIKKNYKDVLLVLESEGKIQTEPSKRRKGTFGDKVKLTFPAKQ